MTVDPGEDLEMTWHTGIPSGLKGFPSGTCPIGSAGFPGLHTCSGGLLGGPLSTQACVDCSKTHCSLIPKTKIVQ